MKIDTVISTADINSVHIMTGVERSLAVVIDIRRDGVSEEHILELDGWDRVKAWEQVAKILAKPTLDTFLWLSPEDYCEGQMDARADNLAERGIC